MTNSLWAISKLKIKDKNNEMIFYKRSGMSNGQQALIDAEDFLKKKSNDHPKSALGLSDYESEFRNWFELNIESCNSEIK